MTDRKYLHGFSVATLAALLIIFLIPFETVGRVLAALILIAAAAVARVLFKKRSPPSLHTQTVILILTLSALGLLMVYYLTGLKFGFYHNPYALNSQVLFIRVLPTAAVIITSEWIRYVVCAQESKWADRLCYAFCVLGEMLICSTADVAVSSFNHLMDMVAQTMAPALVANLLFHYLVKRYGPFPSMIYRLIMTMYLYVIPVESGLSDSLLGFFRLLAPIAIFLFVDALYEKKRRYAFAFSEHYDARLRILSTDQS